MKEFKSRCKNLDILQDYKGSEDLGEEYWSKWKKKCYKPRQGSMVDHEALERVASTFASSLRMEPPLGSRGKEGSHQQARTMGQSTSMVVASQTVSQLG